MNMAQKIEIIRGTSNTFSIEVSDVYGRPYVLEDGESIIFGIKKKPEDDRVIFVKTATASEVEGNYIVSIEPADTAELDCGRYAYDVGLKTATGFFNVIEPNPFMIQPNVTSRGDAV